MTVYKKLTTARARLSALEIKKTGHNNFGTGFSYFELADFMPQVNNIFNEIGLCGVFSFEGDNVTLTIHDTDGTGSVAFVSPAVHAANPRSQAIQNLGGTHTYLRRYMWLMALELVESDAVDSAENSVKVDKPVTKAVEKAVEKLVEKAAEKPVAKAENPNHALFVEKTIEWANLLTTKAELTDVWKSNQPDINQLKEESPELFEQLRTKFNELKSNMKE